MRKRKIDTGDADSVERLAARLDALAAELGQVRDELAILRLVTSYGPLVDGSDTPEKMAQAAQLFGKDGVYDIPGGRFRGPEVAELLARDLHQGLVRDGCAHISSVPHIRVTGDRAEAIGYLHVMRRTDEGFGTFAAAVDCWTFRREGAGWAIIDRIVRVLDGSDEARMLLARITHGSPPPC